MDQAEAGSAARKPLWRRIVDFPLVAMAVSIFMLLAAAGLSAGCAELILRGTHIASGWRTIIMDIAAAAAMILVYKLFLRHLGEVRRDDLAGPKGPLQSGIGAATGVVLFSAIVAVAALLGVYRVVGRGDASLLLFALVAEGLFPAISEELLFRGVLFRWLEEFGGSWTALIVTSALFGVSHLWNPNASLVAAVGIALEAGVMLGAAYMLTRRLWLPMGLHAGWNFTQGEIYDIPVSGNDPHGLLTTKLTGPPLLTGNGFGLEASIIAIVIATAFGLSLLRLAVRRGQVVAPWWVRRRLLSQAAV
jgi:membrane protease YdiL (CAAX protease family)